MISNKYNLKELKEILEFYEECSKDDKYNKIIFHYYFKDVISKIKNRIEELEKIKLNKCYE